MIYLKQSTAVTIKIGPFLDDTDGKTAETGLSIATADVRLSKNGGANGAKNSTTATSHNELGYYNVHLSATDTNTLGALKVMVSKEGALPVWADFMVVHAKVYDALFSTGLVELIAAYDKAKDDVLTPLATVDSLVDTLIDRLTDARATFLDKLDIGDGNTIALENTLTDIKGVGWLQSNHSLKEIATDTLNAYNMSVSVYNLLGEITGLDWEDNQVTLPEILQAIEDIEISGGDNIAAQIRAAVGLALANLDTQLSGILTQASEANHNAENAFEEVLGIAGKLETAKDDIVSAMPTIPSDYATEANATANKNAVINSIPVVPNDYAKEATLTAGIDDVLEAIEDKPVTPVTDLSNLELSIDNLPHRIWAWTVRTLTNPALITPRPGAEGAITLYRSATGRIEFNGLADLDIADKIWFTAKESNSLADNQAILQVEKTAGLVYLYKTNPDDIDNIANNINASLTVIENNVSIILSPEASLRLPVMSIQPIHWDLKIRTEDGDVKILVYGEMYIQSTPTETIGAG